MSYRVIVKPSAEKDFGKLPPVLRHRILEALVRLGEQPRGRGSVKLTGATAYRVRVGDWRIVYEINDGAETVFVTIVAHRREVYRGL